MKLGVIGTSWITGSFTKGAAEAGFELSTVYSRSEEKGRAFAREYGFANVVTDLAQFASSPDVDVVYIASPNGLHYEHAKECLRNKKHVLVEKPCFSSVSQLEQVLKLAKDNDVYALETMRTYYNPSLKALKDSLALVGKLRYAYLHYMKYSSRYDEFLVGKRPPVFDSEMSGGALGDLGVYCAYIAYYLFGTPNRTTSSAALISSGVDGVSTQVLTYDDFLCVISSSKISFSGLRSEIQGEKGTLLIDDPAGVAEVWFSDGKTERVVIKTEGNDMVFQQRELLRILTERDDAAVHESESLMRSTVSFVEDSRNQAGIKYFAPN